MKLLLAWDVPPHATAITYLTLTVPTPVNSNVLPVNIAGPLTSDKVPPAGDGSNNMVDPAQYFPEVGPFAEAIGWIIGRDSAPHICKGAVAYV